MPVREQGLCDLDSTIVAVEAERRACTATNAEAEGLGDHNDVQRAFVSMRLSECWGGLNQRYGKP